MIYQKLSKRQMLAMLWWQQPKFKDRDALIADGSIRSGKSLCMTVGFILWSMSTFKDQKFALCGKTVESLRRNIVLNLRDWLPYDFTVVEKRAENRIVISYNGWSNSYFLFGGRDESSYMLIQGITLAGVLLDEVALMPRSFVEQACARCSIAGSKLWFNCNPAGPEHWFYKAWIEGDMPKKRNALHLHFTMADNLSLAPEIRQRYELMYDGVFYRRYILGEWCIAEGLVYGFFDRNVHVADKLPDAGRYYISVDYGTHNPFSAGLWCVKAGVATRIREYYYNGRAELSQKTSEEYYQEMEKLAGDLPIETVVVDPAASEFITYIRRKGRFSVRKANNAVLDGIRFTSTLLQNGFLKIGSTCEACIKEFGLYSWDDKGEMDKVVKENDHAMDDVRYFAFTIMRREPAVLDFMRGIKEVEETEEMAV